MVYCPRCGYQPKGRTGILRLYKLVKHMEREGYKDIFDVLREQLKREKAKEMI